ncbi:hypothetical protein RhiirA4_477153, partial [Rhizophagus irregularis]
MSYSKIFSDLPELTYEVIKYFKNDFSTLHSYVELKNSSILEFKRLIHMSLFKVIIKNKVNIHTFDIHITYPDSCIDDMLELMLQYPVFFYKIRKLKLRLFHSSPSYSKNFILQMINLYQNLKQISLNSSSFPIYQSLLLSKDYNHSSNTLNTIILYGLNFKVITNLDKLFKQLNVLES